MRNLKSVCASMLAVVALGQSLPASANDVTSAEADCESVAQAARDAQLRYLATYKPRVDPVQTFTQSTDVCLAFISNFDVGFSLNIPSLGDLDAFLRRMATAILTRACQAATSTFNSAVNNAMQSVDQQVAPITSLPGVSAGISTSSGSSGLSVRGAVTTDSGAAVNNAVDTTANRVVNILK